jgi:hypothetical protein
MTTHYAALDFETVIGVRSSASRHVGGAGKFGPYTHAIREVLRTVYTSGVVETTDAVTTWHGGAANAAAGLRAARVGQVREFGNCTVTTVSAAIVPVVVVPRRAVVGAQVAPACACGCGSAQAHQEPTEAAR